MITLRSSQERGSVNLGWLDSKHTFSFGHYYDPNHINFSHLRVINEDKIMGGKGFPSHGHQDMEIITYVLEGALEHKDSLGNGSIMRYGDVQRMSAGTGIIHSEFNHSQTDIVHLLQIWIIPNQKRLEPSYEQKFIPNEEKQGKLRLIGSPTGEQGSVTIHQNVYLYASILESGQEIEHNLPKDHKIWLHIARGAVEVMGVTLKSGDAIALVDTSDIIIKGVDSLSEFLLFDLG